MSAPDVTYPWLRLRYSARLGEPNTWSLHPGACALVVRAVVAGREYRSEFLVRHGAPPDPRQRAVYLRALDASSFLTEPMVLSPELLRVQMHLEHAPPDVADVLRRA